MKKIKIFSVISLTLLSVFIFIQCKTKDDPKIDDPNTTNCISPQDITKIVEVASFDTTFAKANEYMSCTVNWGDATNKLPWADEAALVKISIAQQQDILSKAKKGNAGKDIGVYISGVQIWPAATALYAAIAYKGTQTDFTQVSKGDDVERTVTGNVWTRMPLFFSCPVKVEGIADLYVGAFASNAAASTYPFTILSKNPTLFPGRTATYPSYGVCPTLEKYLQELNDPNDVRWSWTSDSNWCIKVIFSKEIVY